MNIPDNLKYKKDGFGVIYRLKDPITNEVRYIGQTVDNVNRRYKKHLSDAKRLNNHVNLWVRNLLLQGYEPIIEIISNCEIGVIDAYEIYFIKLYRNSGCDLTNTMGGGQLHREFTQETRDKIARTLTGRKQSSEVIEKRAAKVKQAYKDNPALVELKRKQTTALHKLGMCSQKGRPSPKRGRPFEGDKIKLSQSLKNHFRDLSVRNEVATRNGQKSFSVYKANIIQRANRFVKSPIIEQGEYVGQYCNIRFAAQELKVQAANITKCLRGRRNTTGEYLFIYNN